jgi:chemotaxis receptor (MCP) glutamine deamidase CheD
VGRDDPEEWSVKEVVLYLGDIHAALEPTRVKTLLGSCMAVCLYDPVQTVGGMNHFMLPRGGAADAEAARFGIQAMEGLISALLRIGGARRRFVAKVFGGAHVLDIEESQAGVPRQNIEFTRTFLAAVGIPVLAEDVGGYDPRHVHFDTATGRVFLKRALTTDRLASTAPPDRAVTLS